MATKGQGKGLIYSSVAWCEDQHRGTAPVRALEANSKQEPRKMKPVIYETKRNGAKIFALSPSPRLTSPLYVLYVLWTGLKAQTRIYL